MWAKMVYTITLTRSLSSPFKSPGLRGRRSFNIIQNHSQLFFKLTKHIYKKMNLCKKKKASLSLPSSKFQKYYINKTADPPPLRHNELLGRKTQPNSRQIQNQIPRPDSRGACSNYLSARLLCASLSIIYKSAHSTAITQSQHFLPFDEHCSIGGRPAMTVQQVSQFPGNRRGEGGRRIR